MAQLDFLAHIRADGEALVAALEHGPQDAPIAACPGWDVRRLVSHVGGVHRWATAAALTAAEPVRGTYESRPPEGVALADWYRAGLAALLETLAGLDPDGPTWHIFPGPMRASVWIRRQAHETSVHRWDAETAVGIDAQLDPALSSDGIDEYFELAIPRLMQRDEITLPAGSLHVHCTDVDGEWLVRSTDGELLVERAHVKGDAALRGPATDLLLRLWRREAPADLEVVGDATVAEAWLALGGM